MYSHELFCLTPVLGQVHFSGGKQMPIDHMSYVFLYAENPSIAPIFHKNCPQKFTGCRKYPTKYIICLLWGKLNPKKKLEEKSSYTISGKIFILLNHWFPLFFFCRNYFCALHCEIIVHCTGGFGLCIPALSEKFEFSNGGGNLHVFCSADDGCFIWAVIFNKINTWPFLFIPQMLLRCVEITDHRPEMSFLVLRGGKQFEIAKMVVP